jgi:plastocyanin
MEKTLFFVLGITLILAALALAAAGLRNKDFPSQAVFRMLVPLFTVLVLATATFAVLNANANTEERENNEEAAKQAIEQGQQTGVQEADNPDATSATNQVNQPSGASPVTSGSGPTETLKVSSPADGSLSFSPATLDAKAGNVAVDYDNPSPVPHSIAIGSSIDDIIEQSQIGANDTFTVTAELKPGTYVYYCTVPGHAQAGMQGKLTVK